MDILLCPACEQKFSPIVRRPLILSCGHTLCQLCLERHRKNCENGDQDVVSENTVILQMLGEGLEPGEADYSITLAYQQICSFATMTRAGGNTAPIPNLSRPMQRKLLALVNSNLDDQFGRQKALKAARSLAERSLVEIILEQQSSGQLTASLWAAVRARGCQFLGPAMQEEVLRLVLLALEDGSALSRKVLVMFVVQRLSVIFPHASKTSIGHVVQLLYRASCFVVAKRDGDSSLMQLKEEFRTYEALRREHDTQIVQIACEAGLRIAPEQWSSLLYGDSTHRSHMQSIIDKLQSPQTLEQTSKELMSLAARGNYGLTSLLHVIQQPIKILEWNVEKMASSGKSVLDFITAALTVVDCCLQLMQHKNQIPIQQATLAHTAYKYRVNLCRDMNNFGGCPRGSACTFAHSLREQEHFRMMSKSHPLSQVSHHDGH
ncbi:roquin-1 [Galendromus occidentalis]|uniref:RING-type E3 ubiquitin transferase n=1 Tax=Galendromus occidentalis TaxID=34638 RepID=A0AAJ6VXX6_9ACAR|nr:roquin-1 [Galendromus occidentalis]